jgi:hypothetical protein
MAVTASFFFQSSVDFTDGRYGVFWPLGTTFRRQGEQKNGIPKISVYKGRTVVWVNSSMRPVQKQENTEIFLNIHCVWRRITNILFNIPTAVVPSKCGMSLKKYPEYPVLPPRTSRASLIKNLLKLAQQAFVAESGKAFCFLLSKEKKSRDGSPEVLGLRCLCQTGRQFGTLNRHVKVI